MSKDSSLALAMPLNAVVLNEDDMMLVEGGSWKTKLAKKIGEFLFDFLLEKGADYVWSHRKTLWKKFLKGLEPTDATKATPYYQIFSNSIPH